MLFYHASTGIPASPSKGKTRQATEVACLEKPNIITCAELKHVIITIIRRTVNNSRIAAGCKDILNIKMDNIHLGRLKFFTSHVFSSFKKQSKHHVHPMRTSPFIIFPYFGKVNKKMMFVGKSHCQ